MFWKGLRAHRGTQLTLMELVPTRSSFGYIAWVELRDVQDMPFLKKTLRVPFFGTLAMHVEPSVNIDALSSTGIRCHELTLGRPPANIFHGL